jgi:hypothetical protein
VKIVTNTRLQNAATLALLDKQSYFESDRHFRKKALFSVASDSHAALLSSAVTAKAVGHLYDQSALPQKLLGVVTLITPSHALTSAHLVFRYSQYLECLTVRFPACHKTMGIIDIELHPQFDQNSALKLGNQTYFMAINELPLVPYNLALLTLSSEINAITPAVRNFVDSSLAFAYPDTKLGLQGNLAEIELTSIIQTLLHSRKEGRLVLLDKRNQPAGCLQFAAGRLAAARYRHLTGEWAVYQLIADHRPDSFIFYPGSSHLTGADHGLEKSVESLLMESCRRADETPKLYFELGGGDAIYQATTNDGSLHESLYRIPHDVFTVAQRIMPFFDGRHKLGTIADHVDSDCYALYSTLMWLSKVGLVQRKSGPDFSRELEVPQPIRLGSELDLAADENVTSSTLHPVAGTDICLSGHVLSSLGTNHSNLLVHDIVMPPDTSGSPLIQNERLVGIHNGRISKRTGLQEIASLSQSVWIDLFYDLKASGGRPITAKRAFLLNGPRLETIAGKAGSEVFNPETLGHDLPSDCTRSLETNCPICQHANSPNASRCTACGTCFAHSLLQEIFQCLSGKNGVIVLLMFAIGTACGLIIMSICSKSAAIAVGPLVLVLSSLLYVFVLTVMYIGHDSVGLHHWQWHSSLLNHMPKQRRNHRRLWPRKNRKSPCASQRLSSVPKISEWDRSLYDEKLTLNCYEKTHN